jgi:hypothetical protein
VTSGTTTSNTTINYSFTPSISGLNKFQLVGIDSIGYSTSSDYLYIDVIEDNVPSGLFVTRSHTSFPNKKEYVEFNMEDLDFDIIRYELFCNDSPVLSGTTSKEINVKYPIRLPKGIYHYDLYLHDIFVDGDKINGPTIVVIDQNNIQNY